MSEQPTLETNPLEWQEYIIKYQPDGFSYVQAVALFEYISKHGLTFLHYDHLPNPTTLYLAVSEQVALYLTAEPRVSPSSLQPQQPPQPPTTLRYRLVPNTFPTKYANRRKVVHPDTLKTLLQATAALYAIAKVSQEEGDATITEGDIVSLQLAIVETTKALGLTVIPSLWGTLREMEKHS